MSDERKKTRRLELKSGPYGLAFSAVIVLARALSPNSLPVEEWSALSWLLMLSPVMFPLYAFMLFYAAYAIAYLGLCMAGLATDAWDSARRFFRRRKDGACLRR